MVHDGEISTGIQQEGNREQSLLVSAFLAAEEVGGHPDKPVERQESDAGIEFRELVNAALRRVNLVEPAPMQKIHGGDGERLDGVPAAAPQDDCQRSRKGRRGHQSPYAQIADTDGDESQDVGETRDQLRVVAQGVRHHDGRHGEQQSEGKAFAFENAHGANVVHRVGGEVEDGPGAAQNGARDNLVTFAPLTVHAQPQQ